MARALSSTSQCAWPVLCVNADGTNRISAPRSRSALYSSWKDVEEGEGKGEGEGRGGGGLESLGGASEGEGRSTGKRRSEHVVRPTRAKPAVGVVEICLLRYVCRSP